MDVSKESLKEGQTVSSRVLNFLNQAQKLLIPIHKNEFKKFLPTFFIFFLLAYIYDMLRLIKSSIVVATSHVGAEIIPFLKVWALIPGAVLLASIAIRLSRRYDREKVFYFMQSFFILFYILFMTVIYPNREHLELHQVSQLLMHILPEGLAGLASMIHFWHLTVFYVITELWGSILLSMLFWGFANEITSVEQAGRFYPLFLLGANSAAIFAGLTSAAFAGHTFDPGLPFGTSAWEQSLVFYLGFAVVGGMVIMGLFRWMHASGTVEREIHPGKEAGENKVRLSFRDSISSLLRSRHLLYIALIVLSYNMVFNLSDVLWESQLKSVFADDVSGMTHYRSHITTYTGIFSVLISLFVTGNVLRKFGWKHAAVLTPLFILLSGLGFFTLLLTGNWDFIRHVLSAFTSDPMSLALLFGSIQICVSRGSKYTLFDTTKEIAFIPLEKQEKRYGKAAIDGVGSRLGKSAGSLIVQIFLVIFGSIAAATPYMVLIVLIMLGIWISAVRNLGKSLN